MPHLASAPGSVGHAGLPCPVEFVVQDQFLFDPVAGTLEPCSVPMICEGFFSRLEVAHLVEQIYILGAGTEICYSGGTVFSWTPRLPVLSCVLQQHPGDENCTQGYLPEKAQPEARFHVSFCESCSLCSAGPACCECR